MTGCDGINAEMLHAMSVEGIEFDVSVAQNVRIRCQTGFVVVQEITTRTLEIVNLFSLPVGNQPTQIR